MHHLSLLAGCSHYSFHQMCSNIHIFELKFIQVDIYFAKQWKQAWSGQCVVSLNFLLMQK